MEDTTPTPLDQFHFVPVPVSERLPEREKEPKGTFSKMVIAIMGNIMLPAFYNYATQTWWNYNKQGDRLSGVTHWLSRQPVEQPLVVEGGSAFDVEDALNKIETLIGYLKVFDRGGRVIYSVLSDVIHEGEDYLEAMIPYKKSGSPNDTELFSVFGEMFRSLMRMSNTNKAIELKPDLLERAMAINRKYSTGEAQIVRSTPPSNAPVPVEQPVVSVVSDEGLMEMAEKLFDEIKAFKHRTPSELIPKAAVLGKIKLFIKSIGAKAMLNLKGQSPVPAVGVKEGNGEGWISDRMPTQKDGDEDNAILALDEAGEREICGVREYVEKHEAGIYKKWKPL